MLTEFNLLYGHYMDVADKYKQSWMGWGYKGFGNITGDWNGVYDAEKGPNW